jgi:hypothetical protein
MGTKVQKSGTKSLKNSGNDNFKNPRTKIWEQKLQKS